MCILIYWRAEYSNKSINLARRDNSRREIGEASEKGHRRKIVKRINKLKKNVRK